VPVISVLGASLPDNVEEKILAHLSGAGAPTATIYQNGRDGGAGQS